MTIKVIRRENETEYVIEGRLDTVTASEAEEVLVDACEKNEKVILNFLKLDYISSAGLRVMKRLYMTCRTTSHELVIKHVNKMVMEVFEMTGFAGLFKFEA